VTAEAALLVALGALVGAPLRFVVERRLASSYPWGTWIVNVAGSAVLGATAGYVSTLGQPSSAASFVALVGTGFCGSLTTFGGFAAQVLDLAASPSGTPLSGRSLRALGYGAVSLAACVGVAAMFYVATASLTR